MSWSYSLELVAAFSAQCYSDTELSVLLNTTPTPEAFYWPDKTTEHSRLSRFGMTCAPLTGSRGAELLTWFLAASRAKTCQSEVGATVLTESEAGFGLRCDGWFAKYSPDLCAWKTPQCSLLGGLDEFSETWPKWGSMRNGAAYLRPIPVLPMSEREHGFWPTPVASMSKGSSPASLTRKNGRDRSRDRLDHAVMALEGGHLTPEFAEWLMGWPIGHTDLKPLATARFQEWLRSHGASSVVNKEAA
jgi:hypothetical protein